MKNLLLLLILLFTGCTVERNLQNLKTQIWDVGIETNYNSYYALDMREEGLLFKNIHYLREKGYEGIEKEDGTFDTLKLTRGPVICETYLDKNQYRTLSRWFSEDGNFFSEHSYSYTFSSDNLLTDWKSGDSRWHIAYDKNKWIKKHSIYKNDTLIVERKYHYFPLFKKVVARTLDGHGKVLGCSRYRYDSGGRVISSSQNKFQSKIKVQSTYTYSAACDYVKTFTKKDKYQKETKKGYDKYVDNQLVEHSAQAKAKYNDYTEYITYTYYPDKRLKEQVSFDSRWAGKDSSRSVYFYDVDSVKMQSRSIRKDFRRFDLQKKNYIHIDFREYK